MFYEKSFIAAACTLKLKAINPGYLKNYVSGKTFMKLIAQCTYSTQHRQFSFGKTREPTTEATEGEILLQVLYILCLKLETVHEFIENKKMN